SPRKSPRRGWGPCCQVASNRSATSSTHSRWAVADGGDWPGGSSMADSLERRGEREVPHLPISNASTTRQGSAIASVPGRNAASLAFGVVHHPHHKKNTHKGLR